MSKSLEVVSATLALALLGTPALADGDAAKGEKVFKKCAACHTVGEGAAHKVGPHLNDVFGRTAGGLHDYKYSKAMIDAGAGGLVWNEETLATYLADPKGAIKGNKMAFAGLKKADELADAIAYLATFSAEAAPQPSSDAAQADEAPAVAATPAEPAPAAAAAPLREGGVYGLGRVATEEEIAAWDIDVRPDGTGLPEGRGTVADGEVIFTDNCAACHGDFGEAVDRWPVLAGGQGSLTAERPEKTIGSFWPYLSTVFDYVRRAMPYGNARSLSDDEVYALTAYLLYLNDVVTDEDFELSNENFTEIRLPNEVNFIDDDRAEEPHYATRAEPCMTNCGPEPAQVVMRARILDVTPGSADEDSAAGGGVD